MYGTLTVWGYDEDGFWKRNIDCKSDEADDILANISGYDDYDFEYHEI